MYVGPFSAEGPTITKIHAHIQSSGHMLSGKHHEIYLNNPAKTAPEKTKNCPEATHEITAESPYPPTPYRFLQ